MQTTKLVFMVMMGLAMIELSLGQSLNATVSPRLRTSTKTVAAIAAQSKKTMQGLAAVYSDRLSGRKTSSGQTFSQEQFTAAHRSLPLGTKVRVINERNQKTVEVRINDRGPWHSGRVIDLSSAAASKIGMTRAGIALVRLEVISGKKTKES